MTLNIPGIKFCLGNEHSQANTTLQLHLCVSNFTHLTALFPYPFPLSVTLTIAQRRRSLISQLSLVSPRILLGRK